MSNWIQPPVCDTPYLLYNSLVSACIAAKDFSSLLPLYLALTALNSGAIYLLNLACFNWLIRRGSIATLTITVIKIIARPTFPIPIALIPSKMRFINHPIPDPIGLNIALKKLPKTISSN